MEQPWRLEVVLERAMGIDPRPYNSNALPRKGLNLRRPPEVPILNGQSVLCIRLFKT